MMSPELEKLSYNLRQEVENSGVEEGEAKIKAAFTEAYNAGLEAAAGVVEPKDERPCGCKWCDCGKPEDAERVGRWDGEQQSARAIRALKENPPNSAEGEEN